MKILLYILLVGIFVFPYCSNNTPNNTPALTDTSNYSAVEFLEPDKTPTVNIEKYVLINYSNENRKSDAADIIRVKRLWPLAMQSRSAAAFDSILSRNFVFTGNGQLLNRQDYINDRTSPSEWKIIHVKYDNMTLQFFGNFALLTYRNQVTNENIKTKAIEIEYISWSDMYKKEDNKWKINAAHIIDVRVEI